MLKAAGVLLAAVALLLPGMVDATAQQRHRTIFDMLFGPRQVQQQYPDDYYRPEAPRPRRQPVRPKRPPKATLRTPRPALPATAGPQAEAVEKNPDARKILVIGDFIADGLADGLEATFAADPDVTVARSISGSSGFVRDDHYDWPAVIGKILDAEKPAVVVVMLGANDRQAITLKDDSLDLRSPEWTAEYEKRVARFLKAIDERHYPLIWIGEPPFRPKGMSQDMLAINALDRAAVEKAGGKFADVWDGFVDEDGNFTQTGFDINGQTARLRGNDGINITSAGKRKLAFYAEKPLRALLGGKPENAPPAAAGKPDLSKPVDRVAPVSLRDLGRDESGVLLGGNAPYARPSPQGNRNDKPAPGRADDFSWPRHDDARE